MLNLELCLYLSICSLACIITKGGGSGAATSVAELASKSIKLAIEMESESPSFEEQGLQSRNNTICAGLKPPTPLGFGLHPAMAKFRLCSMQGSSGDLSRRPIESNSHDPGPRLLVHALVCVPTGEGGNERKWSRDFSPVITPSVRG